MDGESLRGVEGSVSEILPYVVIKNEVYKGVYLDWVYLGSWQKSRAPSGSSIGRLSFKKSGMLLRRDCSAKEVGVLLLQRLSYMHVF